MNRLLLLILVCFGFGVYSQNVKILKISQDYVRHPDVAGFHYLHEDMKESTYQFVGELRIEFDTIFRNTLKEVYNKFNEKANKLSSNAFRVINSDLYSPGDQKFIEIGIYYLHTEDRNENLRHFQNGKIYLFGFLAHHDHINGYHVMVNGEKMELQELRYKWYQPTAGKVVRVKLGRGFKRDAVKLKVERDMLPRYYTFQIFKGLKRGIISEHEWSFGEMLARILHKQKKEL